MRRVENADCSGEGCSLIAWSPLFPFLFLLELQLLLFAQFLFLFLLLFEFQLFLSAQFSFLSLFLLELQPFLLHPFSLLFLFRFLFRF